MQMENNSKSELNQLIEEIRENTNQISINKIDEVRVMKSMLNDKDFSIGIYDKNLGYVGQKCPHDEAVTFVKNIISGATGLDGKDSKHLAENYEFTKRDANFLLDNMRDFLSVYSNTGRKINIMQTEDTEACLYTRSIPSRTKSVPDKDNPGKNKQIQTNPYIKLISETKCPKYKNVKSE